MADPEAAAPLAGSPAAPPAGAETPASPADAEQISLAEARKLRREAEGLRKRLAEMEAAQLSELDRTKQERDALAAEKATWEAERQARRLTDALGSVPGVLYPDLLLSRIDPAAVDYAADGTPRNLPALVAPLRTRYPALFRTDGGDGGAGVTGGTPALPLDMNQTLRRLAGRAG